MKAYYCGTCMYFAMDVIFKEYKCGYGGMCGGHGFREKACHHYFPTRDAPPCKAKGKPQLSAHVMDEAWDGQTATCLHCGFATKRGEYVAYTPPPRFTPATAFTGNIRILDVMEME